MLSISEHRLFEEQGFLGPFDLDGDFEEQFGPHFAEKVIMTVLLSGTPSNVIRYQHIYSSSLTKFATNPAILERVRKIIGPDILLWQGHFLARQPGYPGMGWHIDSTSRVLQGINVTVAVNDMHEDNSAIYLIPNTHRYRVSLRTMTLAKTIDARCGKAWLDFADQIAPWNAPHKIRIMKPTRGQFYIVAGGLWHSVGLNRTSQVRVAGLMRFSRPDVTCRDYGLNDGTLSFGEKQPCLLISGTDRYGLNDIRSPVESGADIFR